MVTRNPSPRVPALSGRAPRPRRAGLRAPLYALAVLLAVLLGILLGAAPAAAQSGTLYFFTAKRGVADATGSGEELFTALEGVHGSLQDTRSVDTSAIELDVYGVSQDLTGLGIGMEVLRYVKDWRFADGELVHMEAKGVLFSLKTFLRLGPLFPFAGVGFGNYYVNYDQTTGTVSLRDSPSSVLNVRAGFRLLLGRVGLLAEGGNTRAQLDIPSSAGRQSLELGGTYANVGLSWIF